MELASERECMYSMGVGSVDFEWNCKITDIMIFLVPRIFDPHRERSCTLPTFCMPYTGEHFNKVLLADLKNALALRRMFPSRLSVQDLWMDESREFERCDMCDVKILWFNIPDC